MNNKKNTSYHLSISISKQELAALQHVARSQNISVSQWIKNQINKSRSSKKFDKNKDDAQMKLF